MVEHLLARVLLVAALSASLSGAAPASVTSLPFGRLPDGTPVLLYVLKSPLLEARITSYGGRIVSLRVPDRAGRVTDVIVGPDTLEGFLAGNPHFGGIVGRYANRIARGELPLDGRIYTLPRNNGGNTLHGGARSYDDVLWNAQVRGDSLVLTHTSPDGDQGFPGSLHMVVTYTVSGGALRIDYEATTDSPTVVNLTNHAYFNLAGEAASDILGHELTVFAEAFTPVDAGLIPTGELRAVADTPLDFRQPHRIGERINADDEQMRRGSGYDHNFVLRGGVTDAPRLAARAVDPVSGRVLEVLTTEPGLQLYTANFLGPSDKVRGGAGGVKNGALCLETQHFPDSPHHAPFPSTVLRPGQTFRSTTTYRFAAR